MLPLMTTFTSARKRPRAVVRLRVVAADAIEAAVHGAEAGNGEAASNGSELCPTWRQRGT